MHTNQNGVCPDRSLRNAKVRDADYPCAKHGVLGRRGFDWVDATLCPFGPGGGPNGTVLLNLQGPGVDDSYGGYVFNRGHPLRVLVHLWLEQTFPAASPYEGPGPATLIPPAGRYAALSPPCANTDAVLNVATAERIPL